MLKSSRILGIDPGTNILGFAVIEVSTQPISLLDMGVITMSRYDDHPDKLRRIFDRTCEIILTYSPSQLAIEAPFYGKNVQSMLKLGRAQGVAMAAGLTHSLEIIEYSPKKIKQSVTGNGNASKEQVAAMLKTILNREMDEKFLDATDALATAVCHYFQSNGKTGVGAKKKNGWKSFLAENPQKMWKP